MEDARSSHDRAEPAETDGMQFFAERGDRHLGIPRPVDDERNADDRFLRDESPEPAVKAVVAVVPHAEDIVSLDGVLRRGGAVDEDRPSPLIDGMPFTPDERIPALEALQIKRHDIPLLRDDDGAVIVLVESRAAREDP